MNMTQEVWNKMPESERVKVRSDAGLTKQLIGLEGWRVEVVTTWGETMRGIVSRSSGWQPCHILLKLRTSHGGMGCFQEYASVRKLYRVR